MPAHIQFDFGFLAQCILQVVRSQQPLKDLEVYIVKIRIISKVKRILREFPHGIDITFWKLRAYIS
jgi:hypothetical protein